MPDPAATTVPGPTGVKYRISRERLFSLLAQWAAAREGGATLTPDELCSDDPVLREILAVRIKSELAIDDLTLTTDYLPSGADGSTKSANAPTESVDWARPAEIPGYTLVRELGRGANGVVYEVRQHGLNRPAAMKLLLTTSPAHEGATARFLAEAEAVAAIRHPNVVQVYEFGRLGSRPYIAMELCPSTLRARLAAGPVSSREAAVLVGKIARGVQAAHDQQIVHRDLKPGNVLLDPDGEPKVSDFGLAKRGLGADLTRTDAVMGTPDYMAPEQAEGRAKFVGPAADVWALGVIFYECLTGTRPFSADSAVTTVRQVLDTDPPAPRTINPTIPRGLEWICLKCLEKAPADRYASASDLAADLDNHLAGRPTMARPGSIFVRAWKYAANAPVETCLALLFGALFLRFVVGNSHSFFGFGLPEESNGMLRLVMNLAIFGTLLGAALGGLYIGYRRLRGERLPALETISQIAIFGLIVGTILSLILPSLGSNANNTFSNVSSKAMPAAGSP
jgi:hypothetical protein